jgi:hypothetical protein
MATKKIEPITDKKVPIAQIRAENVKMREEIAKLKESAYCRMCDSIKDRSKFYVSTDPMCKGGVTPICKECARKIAERVDKFGDSHEPTKESAQLALRYLDKPFIETVWNASIQESENLASGKVKTNAYRAYMKNIQMGQYNGLGWKDSDMFKVRIKYEDEKTEQEIVEEHAGMDTYDSYIKNKEDVIRLLDYDPFEKEPVSDQPFLYSQLLGMLDASEDANDDMMRVSSAIQIVRGFLQLQKIDDTMAKLMGNINEVQDNSATIKSLQDSKQKITSMITNLAAESCLSLKNSKRQVKGENTWTGKIKRIKDLNLREGEMNGFDVATCKGMQQVQEISDASIMKQLALDESEWSDIVANMRETNQRLRKEKDSYKEINRILLKENLDLKDYLDEKGIKPKGSLKNLRDLYSVFSGDIEFTGEEENDYESDNSSL